MANSPVAPTIDANGISAPAFSDILSYLVQQYQLIYGADVYLGNDSQDFQFISVVAQALADCNAVVVATYNSFSPNTAQGAGLSSRVKINGLTRKQPSASRTQVTVNGVANTPITNGQVRDPAGNLWALPPLVTIPSTGSITVTATCTTLGAVQLSTGPAIIATPTFGWQSAAFAAAAAPGAPVEVDAALRVRQAASVALSSQTVFEGVVAAIEAVSGVTRVAGFENNQASANANGIPANSLCFVVEGGAPADIYQAIFKTYTPGIGLFGNQSSQIVSAAGSIRTIAYQLPMNSTIGVTLTVTPGVGWSTSAEPVIAAAVTAYINSQTIGQSFSCLGLAVPALLVGPTIQGLLSAFDAANGTNYAVTYSQFIGTYTLSNIAIGKNGGTQATADVTLAFDEAPVAAPSNVAFVIA